MSDGTDAGKPAIADAPSKAAYRLLADRFEHPAGTLVYMARVHDYGLASDDAQIFGIEHVSVTLDPAGGYPTFTVPERDIAKATGGQS